MSIFPVVSLRQIKELASMRYNIIITEIQKARNVQDVLKFTKIVILNMKKRNCYYPNLYEKGMIIESIAHIEDSSNGAVFDMKNCEK